MRQLTQQRKQVLSTWVYVRCPQVVVRTHNLNRRAAKNLRLRPRVHWDRRIQDINIYIYIYYEEAYVYNKRELEKGEVVLA